MVHFSSYLKYKVEIVITLYQNEKPRQSLYIQLLSLQDSEAQHEPIQGYKVMIPGPTITSTGLIEVLPMDGCFLVHVNDGLGR